VFLKAFWTTLLRDRGLIFISFDFKQKFAISEKITKNENIQNLSKYDFL
jgi:hypothetical protein